MLPPLMKKLFIALLALTSISANASPLDSDLISSIGAGSTLATTLDIKLSKDSSTIVSYGAVSDSIPNLGLFNFPPACILALTSQTGEVSSQGETISSGTVLTLENNYSKLIPFSLPPMAKFEMPIQVLDFKTPNGSTLQLNCFQIFSPDSKASIPTVGEFKEMFSGVAVLQLK